MNQANSQASKIAGPDQNRAPRSQLRKIERRQWWLWVSAAVIGLLLTLGMVSFAFSIPHAESDIIYLLNLPRAVYGLLGLVLLFDIYVVYQQLQTSPRGRKGVLPNIAVVVANGEAALESRLDTIRSQL